MKLADFNKLQKLMAMTASDNDGEALNALRAANAILKKYDITWERVFKRLVTVEIEEAPSEPPSSAARDIALEAALDKALKSSSGGFRDFLLSLQAQWHEKGWLSPAQREAVFKAARR